MIATIATGRVHLPMHLKEMGRRSLGYPSVGDMRRPTDHSRNGGIVPSSHSWPPRCPNWAMEFWDRCLAGTRLRTVAPARSDVSNKLFGGNFAVPSEGGSSRAQISFRTTRGARLTHRLRHEAAFGLAAYGLATLEELLRLANGTGILGRGTAHEF